MVRRLTLALTLMAMVGLVAAPAVAAAPPTRGDALAQTVEGATVTVNSLTRDGTQLLADVTVTNDLTGDSVTGLVPAAVGAACDILTLDLGPLDLDVLGLVVELSEVNLDITAEPGPGNLLGNLLCAVAGLLDGPSPLAGAIDRLLGLINGLLG
jgi:hypothetical protein